MKKSNNGSILRLFEYASKMKVETAIKEFIDNSIDADASHIDVVLDAKHLYFSITDDGKGMSKTKLKNYRCNYHSHMPPSDNTIGLFGVGLKDAVLALADYKTGTTVGITSATNYDKIVEYNFTVNGRDENAWLNANEVKELAPNENWNKEERGKDWSSSHGHRVVINRIKPIPTKNKKWKSNLIKSIMASYPYLIEKKHIKIKINGGYAEGCVDRMHLKYLCDDIYKSKCGIKINNGLVFWTKEIKLINQYKESDVRNIKVVYLYISKDSDNTINDQSFSYSGMYSMYRGRYIDTANKKLSIGNLSATDTKRGGCGRFRALILIDGNEDILSIDDNKKSIELGNASLERYKTEDGKSFYEVFESDFNKMPNLHLYATRGTNGKFYRPLTKNIIKSILEDNASVNRLIAEYNSQNNIENSELEDELDAPINDDDDLMYASSTTSVKHAKNVLKSFEDKPNIIKFYKNKDTGTTEYSFTEDKSIDFNIREATVLADVILEYSGRKLNKDTQQSIVNKYLYAIAYEAEGN